MNSAPAPKNYDLTKRSHRLRLYKDIQALQKIKNISQENKEKLNKLIKERNSISKRNRVRNLGGGFVGGSADVAGSIVNGTRAFGRGTVSALGAAGRGTVSALGAAGRGTVSALGAAGRGIKYISGPSQKNLNAARLSVRSTLKAYIEAYIQKQLNPTSSNINTQRGALKNALTAYTALLRRSGSINNIRVGPTTNVRGSVTNLLTTNKTNVEQVISLIEKRFTRAELVKKMFFGYNGTNKNSAIRVVTNSNTPVSNALASIGLTLKNGKVVRVPANVLNRSEKIRQILNNKYNIGNENVTQLATKLTNATTNRAPQSININVLDPLIRQNYNVTYTANRKRKLTKKTGPVAAPSAPNVNRLRQSVQNQIKSLKRQLKYLLEKKSLNFEEAKTKKLASQISKQTVVIQTGGGNVSALQAELAALKKQLQNQAEELKQKATNANTRAEKAEAEKAAAAAEAAAAQAEIAVARNDAERRVAEAKAAKAAAEAARAANAAAHAQALQRAEAKTANAERKFAQARNSARRLRLAGRNSEAKRLEANAARNAAQASAEEARQARNAALAAQGTSNARAAAAEAATAQARANVAAVEAKLKTEQKLAVNTAVELMQELRNKHQIEANALRAEAEAARANGNAAKARAANAEAALATARAASAAAQERATAAEHRASTATNAQTRLVAELAAAEADRNAANEAARAANAARNAAAVASAENKNRAVAAAKAAAEQAAAARISAAEAATRAAELAAQEARNAQARNAANASEKVRQANEARVAAERARNAAQASAAQTGNSALVSAAKVVDKAAHLALHGTGYLIGATGSLGLRAVAGGARAVRGTWSKAPTGRKIPATSIGNYNSRITNAAQNANALRKIRNELRSNTNINQQKRTELIKRIGYLIYLIQNPATRYVHTQQNLQKRERLGNFLKT